MKTAAIAALATVTIVVAMAAEGNAQTDGGDGQALFEQNCVACHQAGGTGVPGAFPPLAGNPDAADPVHVATVIRNGLSGPLEVLGQTYNGQMPPFPQLTDAQVEAIAGYVQGLAGSAPTTSPPTTAAPAAAADTAAGRAIFTGSARLDNGGPACMSCHAAGGLNHLGGSGLGPDLTGVVSRLGGQAGLSGWLANPPTPTMQSIFATRSLTPVEVADVVAFLDGASTETASSRLDWLWILTAGGLAGLLGFMALVMRRPTRNYVQRLRSNP